MPNHVYSLHASKHFPFRVRYAHDNNKTEALLSSGTLFVAINTSPCQHNERPFFNFLKDQTKKFIF